MKKLFVHTFAIICFLFIGTGCAILSSSDENSMYHYSDDEIRASIASSLTEKDPEQAHKITVECYLANVFLLGEAEPTFQPLAVSIAQQTKGVKQVISHWIPPSQSSDKMHDATVAADINSQIFLEEELSSTRMSVDVFSGDVIICGVMPDKKSIEKVIEIARETEGVKSVTSYLIY